MFTGRRHVKGACSGKQGLWRQLELRIPKMETWQAITFPGNSLSARLKIERFSLDSYPFYVVLGGTNYAERNVMTGIFFEFFLGEFR